MTAPEYLAKFTWPLGSSDKLINVIDNPEWKMKYVLFDNPTDFETFTTYA